MNDEFFFCRITKTVDSALQLSYTYGIQKIDFAHVLIFFFLSVIMSLIDGLLEDWGLHFEPINRHGSRNVGEVYQVMDIDAKENSDDMKHEHRELLLRANSVMTLEVLEKLTANGKAKVFLRLIHYNMYGLRYFLFHFLNFCIIFCSIHDFIST